MGDNFSPAMRRKQEASNGNKKSAFKHAGSTETTFRKVFPVSELSVEVLLTCIESAADASALVSFGFNRSGGINITAIIEGERVTVSAFGVEDAHRRLQELSRDFAEYTASKGWGK